MSRKRKAIRSFSQKLSQSINELITLITLIISLLSKMASKLVASSNISSIHGINYIISKNVHILIRIFWTFALILSIFALSINIYRSFIKWKISPDIVRSSEMISSDRIPLPAITICNPVIVKNKFGNYGKFKDCAFSQNATKCL
jgi:hypothetical protein